MKEKFYSADYCWITIDCELWTIKAELKLEDSGYENLHCVYSALEGTQIHL